MALIWLVLIGLIAFAYHANSRLRRLEERFESEFGRTYHYAPALAEPEVPEPVAAPVPTAPVEENREPEVISYYQPPKPPEIVDAPHEDFQEPEERRRWNLSVSFEDLFGRRLPIWAGGITLAVAGMLIVKLSIESGLLTPPIRVISARRARRS